MNCWYLVLTQTRRESRDHATLNDIFMNNVIVRLSQISEDVIRLFKKVMEQRWRALLAEDPSSPFSLSQKVIMELYTTVPARKSKGVQKSRER